MSVRRRSNSLRRISEFLVGCLGRASKTSVSSVICVHLSQISLPNEKVVSERLQRKVKNTLDILIPLYEHVGNDRFQMAMDTFQKRVISDSAFRLLRPSINPPRTHRTSASEIHIFGDW